MRTGALKLLLGVGGPLILAGQAAGGWVGLDMEMVPNTYGLLVIRVYAEFDNPQDRVLAVAGTLESPLRIQAMSGEFYQHPTFGGDTAPNENLIIFFPSLAYDTFVSIGRTSQTPDDPDTTQLSPDWPGFDECRLMGTDLSWSVPADDPQGLPDQHGQVFIGQFSSPNGSPTGRLLIRAVSDGDPSFEVDGSFSVLFVDGWSDLNTSECVDLQDFLILLSVWGTDTCWADIDANGVVGIGDFLFLLSEWSPCRP